MTTNKTKERNKLNLMLGRVHELRAALQTRLTAPIILGFAVPRHPNDEPDLLTLLRDPSLIDSVSRERIPDMLADLRRLEIRLQGRYLTTASAHTHDAAEDKLLDVREAAKKLNVSRDWLYRRSTSLPFVVRVGHHLRFSSQRIEKYIRNRALGAESRNARIRPR